MNHSGWLLVVNALAVYRLARLITRDTIFDRQRTAMLGRWVHGRRKHMQLAELIVCPWCVSVWIAAGVLVLTRYCLGWWQWVAVGLAMSAVAGFLSSKE